jgi:hypothetical protein
MKIFQILSTVLFLIHTYGMELDIDKINNEQYKISFDNKAYQCTSPPVSHGWYYECSKVLNRNLRTKEGIIIPLYINKINDNEYKISFDNKVYDCINEPPSNHTAVYECSKNLTDKEAFSGELNGQHLDCSKCYRECGGNYPTQFPDAFCSRCIPNCYH